MILKLKALWFMLTHRKAVVSFVVVRRYVDAQKNFIGELYMTDDDKPGTMIGMSCDNLPFNVGAEAGAVKATFCWRKDFLEPMDPSTIRVGSLVPSENDAVRQLVSLRRYCKMRMTIVNRFVEHVLEDKYASN